MFRAVFIVLILQADIAVAKSVMPETWLSHQFDGVMCYDSIHSEYLSYLYRTESPAVAWEVFQVLEGFGHCFLGRVRLRYQANKMGQLLDSWKAGTPLSVVWKDYHMYVPYLGSRD
ncbi:hypothetical protein CL653_01135 [bacterium]|nr:hypothetical protein [bacterium]